MKHLKPSFFGVILLFCISAFSMQQLIAQNNRSSVTPDLVEGRVIDSHRNPIVGATITVEGTSRGTTSDSEGRFAIKATDSDLLHISFVGYKSVALRLAPGALHEILMEDETAAIDEVVVVGFGTQK